MSRRGFMGFFSKLFKKASDAPETKEQQAQKTVEECSMEEDVSEVIETEEIKTTSIAVEEPVAEELPLMEEPLIAEVKEEIVTPQEKQRILGITKSQEVTYESFFESEQIQHLEELRSFTSKVWNSEQVARQFPSLVAFTNQLGSSMEQIVPTLTALQEEVQQFRQKDVNLRTIIENYTKVITEINNKKLKDNEFQQVKEKLEPQLDAIKKQREDFLVQEKTINTKINVTIKELDKMYALGKEIATKL